MYEQLVCKIPAWDVRDKIVFLRADFNVPLTAQGALDDDTRLRATMPTIDALIAKGARVIIGTHLGSKESVSTQVLVQWFAERSYAITFVREVSDLCRTLGTTSDSLLLLENLRLFSGERAGDTDFAKSLAVCADFYVDDAFGTLARTDASITILPTFFDSEHRSIGFLVEHELHDLSHIHDAAERPVLCILGGGKVQEKMALVRRFMSTVDTIMLCPAFSQETDLLDVTAESAFAGTATVLYPIDYLVAQGDWHEGMLSYKDASDVRIEDAVIAVGPKTLAAWREAIACAGTIFFNGPMGYSERPETLKPVRLLLQLVAESPAYKVIVGGDSSALIKRFGFEERMDYISTGGGAALAFLSGEKLPGLEALK